MEEIVTVSFPKGGNNLALTINLSDDLGKPLDISGSEVKLVIDYGKKGDDIFEQIGDIVNAEMGACRFILMSDGALSKAGRWRARVVMTEGETIIPSDWFIFIVFD